MKLHELNQEIINAIENMEDGVDVWDLLSQFSDKIEDLCNAVNYYNGFASTAKEEKERVAKLQKSAESKAEGIKRYISQNLEAQGIDKIDAGLYKLSFRNSDSIVIEDESQIPESFKQTVETVKIDKAALKKAHKDVAVPGARLEKRRSLQIK